MWRILVLLIALAGCDAGHLGNPLTLPIRGAIAGAENAAYDRDRSRVKTYITENEAALKAERFDGPVTATLLSVVPETVREKVRAEVRDAARYADFAERATVIVMVHR